MPEELHDLLHEIWKTRTGQDRYVKWRMIEARHVVRAFQLLADGTFGSPSIIWDLVSGEALDEYREAAS